MEKNKKTVRQIMSLIIALTVALSMMTSFAALAANKKTKVTEKKLEQMTGNKACFVGDSLMQGVYLFSPFQNAKYVTKIGLNVINAQNAKKRIWNNGTTTLSILDGIKSKNPRYIYIMLGANELDWLNTNVAIKYYNRFVSKIKKKCPKATVTILSVQPATAAYCASHNGFTNAKVRSYNKALKKLAKKQKVKFISLYQYFADQNGNLRSELAGVDGLHWKNNGVQVFYQALRKELKK